MKILTMNDIFSCEEGYLYSIPRNELIPFEREIIRDTDNDFYADAKYIVNTIENIHPYFISEYYNFNEYKIQRKDFINNSKKANLEIFEFYIKIQKYFRTLCDGHMLFLPLNNLRLPINIKLSKNRSILIDNNIHIYEIGKKDIKEIIASIKELIYFENESEMEYLMPLYLKNKCILEYMGCQILDNEVEIQFCTGEKIYHFKNILSDEIQSKTDSKLSSYTIEDYLIDDILYLDYRECKVDNELKYVANNIREFIKLGINKIIIDIRNNKGGTYEANNILLEALGVNASENGGIIRLSNDIKKQLKYSYKLSDCDEKVYYTFYKPVLNIGKNNKSKIIVLTSRYTYSSAMQLALAISDSQLGIIVGETPGDAPCGFGDLYLARTPRLNLSFYVSHKYFIRADINKEKNELIPDVIVNKKESLVKAIHLLQNGNDITKW